MKDMQYSPIKNQCSDLESSPTSVEGNGRNEHLRKTISQLYVVAIHILLLFIFVHHYFLPWKSGVQTNHNQDEIASPAVEAVVIVTKKILDPHSHSEFTGLPNEGNTKAWEDLLLPGFFNATAEEIAAAGASTEYSVKVADGGYLASLHVYHDIHCLRRLRLWLYRDTYYPHIDPTRVVDIQRHLDHCIESLRRDIMCKADTSVDTFVWSDPAAQKPAMKSTGMRKCVDWEKFEDWSLSRSIDLHPYVIRTNDDLRV